MVAWSPLGTPVTPAEAGRAASKLDAPPAGDAGRTGSGVEGVLPG